MTVLLEFIDLLMLVLCCPWVHACVHVHLYILCTYVYIIVNLHNFGMHMYAYC